jgi:hypothetical protein
LIFQPVPFPLANPQHHHQNELKHPQNSICEMYEEKPWKCRRQFIEPFFLVVTNYENAFDIIWLMFYGLLFRGRKVDGASSMIRLSFGALEGREMRRITSR